MSELRQCSVGFQTSEDCHKTTLTPKAGLLEINEIEESDRKLLALRANLQNEIENICYHHKTYYLVRYESFQRVCCDVFGIHAKDDKTIKGSLRRITDSQANEAQKINLQLIPGKKLCPSCRKKLLASLSESSGPFLVANVPSEDQMTDSDDEIPSLEHSISIEEDRDQLSECFSAIGISPIKLHGLPESSRVHLGKRKLGAAISSIEEKVAKAVKVSTERLSETQAEHEKDLLLKAESFNRMMNLLREKVQSLPTSKAKIHVLTLCPSNWTIKKAVEFFQVSEYLIRRARALANEKGILSMPEPRKGHELPKTTIDLVSLFYQDDEFTRPMPGRKDCVSVARNVYEQKRLVLCNLRELHLAFKTRHPEAKIGFSKFCSLRPKWCVLATVPDIKAFDFVCCLYESHWWIGIILSTNEEFMDAEVKFMHPKGPARSFHWPYTDDICWVPYSHMIHKIAVPETTSGRQYQLNTDDLDTIKTKYSKLSQE